MAKKGTLKQQKKKNKSKKKNSSKPLKLKFNKRIQLAVVDVHDEPKPERIKIPLESAHASFDSSAMYHSSKKGVLLLPMIIGILLLVSACAVPLSLGSITSTLDATQQTTQNQQTITTEQSSSSSTWIIGAFLGGLGLLVILIGPKYMAARVALPKFYVDSTGHGIAPEIDTSEQWARFFGQELKMAQSTGDANKKVGSTNETAGDIIAHRIASLRSTQLDPPFSPYIMGGIEDMDAAVKFFTISESLRPDRNISLIRPAVLIGLMVACMLLLQPQTDKSAGSVSINTAPIPTPTPVELQIQSQQ